MKREDLKEIIREEVRNVKDDSLDEYVGIGTLTLMGLGIAMGLRVAMMPDEKLQQAIGATKGTAKKLIRALPIIGDKIKQKELKGQQTDAVAKYLKDELTDQDVVDILKSNPKLKKAMLDITTSTRYRDYYDLIKGLGGAREWGYAHPKFKELRAKIKKGDLNLDESFKKGDRVKFVGEKSIFKKLDPNRTYTVDDVVPHKDGGERYIVDQSPMNADDLQLAESVNERLDFNKVFRTAKSKGLLLHYYGKELPAQPIKKFLNANENEILIIDPNDIDENKDLKDIYEYLEKNFTQTNSVNLGDHDLFFDSNLMVCNYIEYGLNTYAVTANSKLNESLNEGFEWWHPLVSLAGGVGLALLPFFAVLGPGMILHPGAMVPGGSWADVYRHYKKKFKDKQTAKKLTNEDVLEFIKFIEDNVSELPSGVQKWMKGLINKLKAEMNKDEEELDKNKLLVLMRDVENYAKRKGVKIDNAINEEAAPKFTAKEFVAYVNDEFDSETLQLMANVLAERLKFLDKMKDMANPRTVVQGYMRKDDLKENLGRYDVKLEEGAFSELQILADESGNFEEFFAKVKQEFPDAIDDKMKEMLRSMYGDESFNMTQEIVNESIGLEVQSVILEIAEAFGYKGGKHKSATVLGMLNKILPGIPKKEKKSFLREVTLVQQIYGIDEIIL